MNPITLPVSVYLALAVIIVTIYCITNPDPTTHCQQQLTLTTDACYLELTK